MDASQTSNEPDVAACLSRPAWHSWWPGILLVALTLLCYAPSLRNGFIWDDDRYVSENPALRSVRGLARIWAKLGTTPQYYPLTFTTFWIDYQLWGLSAPGYHAVNVVLHAACAVMLWRLLLRLAVPGAWLAAAIFALHPVEVESVGWITERKNVLSLACALASLLCYLRFAPPEESSYPASSDRTRWRFYDLSFAFFVAALLSKSVTASLPAVLLVTYWWKRGEIGWQDVQPLLRFFIAGIALGLMTTWYEKHYVGAEGDEWSFTLLDRCLIAGRAMWFYAGKLAWPHPLIFFYPHWDVESADWRQYLYPLAAAGLVLGAWLARRRIGRAPLAALLIFGGVLLPALGFLNVYPFRYSYVADHFQYHASIGLIVLAAAALVTLAERCGMTVSRAVTVLAVVVLAPLALITFGRQSVYRDPIALYTDTIEQNPSCWMAYNNLGNALAATGRAGEAVPYYEQTLRMKPEFVETYNNLAVALAGLDRQAEALQLLQQALERDAEHPDVHTNVGRSAQSNATAARGPTAS